jgi:hypothetical protein
MTPEKKEQIKTSVLDSLKDQLKQLSDGPNGELAGGFAATAIDRTLSELDSSTLDDFNLISCSPITHNHIAGCGRIDAASND